MTRLLAERTAHQSSTLNRGIASLAIDGRTADTWRSGSCTHTASELSPWWYVDLGTAQLVIGVTLINRRDCCGK